jgi:hypothetical protein
MTPNLPLSLALFIPTKDHVEAEKALVAHVEQLVSYMVEQAEENLRRRLIRELTAFLAGHDLEAAPAEDVPERTRIKPGEFGQNHEQYVATFRNTYLNGWHELRAMLNGYPPGTTLTPAQHQEIKDHFGMGTRSLLLAPMLRELGCRENRSGRWITPVLRNETTGGY